ncbi:tellurite resistance/C4-dicarboxylate transporter family protein [Streptantibioticus parmotrematis]|nr:tellurite resistance/C4-dicarboxylate transporter family protein [Streptantibioticus parmotrematis]
MAEAHESRSLPRGRWVRFLRAVPPAAGAAAMATGALSIGCGLLGAGLSSGVFLVLGCLIWAMLAAAFCLRLRYEGERWWREAATPPALTSVAATAVLGTRFALLGWTGVAVALLCLAVVAWVPLLARVLRHRGRKVPGAAYLVCVSTQALAVLIASVALDAGAAWLAWPAAGLVALGLALYAVTLERFDARELRHGKGDHWVACSALAITALAVSRLADAAAPAGPLHWATGAHDALRIAGFVLLGLALAAYAVLVCCEIRWPRPRYDVRRWSTVNPMAMTALATIAWSVTAGVGWLRTLGGVLLWVALLAWAVTGVAAVRRGGRPAGPPRVD